MPVSNNPSNNAATVQGPGPTGQEGYPVPTVPATGAIFPVSISSGGGGAATIADGADVTQGAIADAAVVGDLPGTVNAHLRGLTLQEADITASGTLAANGQTVTLQLSGRGAAVVSISGVWSGQVNLFADPGTGIFGVWYANNPAAQNSAQTFTTGNVTAWIVPVAGLTAIQLQAQAWASGTATIRIRACDVASAFNTNCGFSPQSINSQIQDITGLFANVPLSSTGANLFYRQAPFWQNGANLVLARTPGTFQTAQALAAGNTALWTPAAGKKFRLMRYLVTVTDDATRAAPGVLTVSLFDAAAGATGQAHDVYVPAVALVNTGALYQSGWIDLGNGFLSAAVNNVLNINLSAALVTGNVRVIACGTEE